jgi:hypothetical protein
MSDPDQYGIWLWATDGVQSGFASAYAEFRRDLLQAVPGPEAVAELSSVHEVYLEELRRRAQSPTPDRPSEHPGAAYADALRRIFGNEAAQRNVSAAFDRYILSLKTAWNQVDPAAVRPADLAVIAQSIAWIASVSADLREVGKPDG